MNRSSITKTAVSALQKHPYLCAFIICLMINPFFLGSINNIPTGALWLEAFIICGVTVFAGIFKYRKDGIGRNRTAVFIALMNVANLSLLKVYSQSQHKAVWHCIGGCAAVLLIYYFADVKNFRRQLNSLMIMSFGFFLKLYYILITSVYTRQHDVRAFGEDSGHAGYIEYLLYNHSLPDFDVRERWQFCHPPLHHALSAVWIYVNENIFLTGYNPARESLQMLTLFYSMCVMISAYRLLRYFGLEGRALYIPLIIINFHPSFIILSGSINNDILSAAFIMGAVINALCWYRDRSMKSIISIALCIGLGMMTKVSAAAVAPPAAILFLIVFFMKFRTEGKKLIGQFVVFALICLPLGLWFGVRNYIRWDMPLTYVQEMNKTELQYIGDQDFSERITDFSGKQFDSIYLQWAEKTDSGEIKGYNEYNPAISALKTAVFDEYGNNLTFREAPYLTASAKLLFWDNFIITAVGGVCMICMLFIRCRADTVHKLYLLSFQLLLFFSFFKMAHDYPFTCTMNFRYITPVVITGGIAIGIMFDKMGDSDVVKAVKTGKAFVWLMSVSAVLFAAASSVYHLLME